MVRMVFSPTTRICTPTGVRRKLRYEPRSDADAMVEDLEANLPAENLCPRCATARPATLRRFCCPEDSLSYFPGLTAGTVYFAEHFLGSHLGLEPASFLNHPALKEQAQFLSALPECPVHRDSQSQNVHIHAGKTWLIDFQGMRGGRPEYDLASLVYDGYARLEPEQADELLREWENISAHSIDHRIFRACALQRIMQMLGAYANIGHNQGKTWYLAQIPAGLGHLRKLLPGSTLAEPLAAMLA
ncbi:MAG: phosphotransferase [Akkermansia muciniphila]